MHLYRSLSEAARIAGRHPSTLRERIRRGDLVATKPVGMATWTIRDDHLAAFLAGERVAPLTDAAFPELRDTLFSDSAAREVGLAGAGAEA